MRWQCLERGCISDVASWHIEIILAIRSFCCAHFLKGKGHCCWTFLLHQFQLLLPRFDSQCPLWHWSPQGRWVCLFGGRGRGRGWGRWYCRNCRTKIIIELVFNLIWVGHYGCMGTFNCCMPLTIREVSASTGGHVCLFGSPESLQTKCALMANPTPASHRF